MAFGTREGSGMNPESRLYNLSADLDMGHQSLL
jgi:hypothetical protein